MTPPVDIAVVGAGAAGLMAAIQAGRSAARSGRRLRTLLLDGAKKPGAKILVAGGGRCNVTHDTVDESAYAGSSPKAIRNVLRRFDVPETTVFFRELGVELKREETGKLFPVSDSARTVLHALLRAAAEAGVELRHPCRIASIRRAGEEYALDPGGIRAGRVILATGGKSLPRSGSDGHGYRMAAELGHSLTPRLLPGLVPLVLPEGHFLRALSGVTFPATVAVRGATGKILQAFTDSTLATHFGLSGPSVMDLSRYYLDAVADDPRAMLVVNFLPGETPASVDRLLAEPGSRSPLARLRERMPERLARALCEHAGVDPSLPGHQLAREPRRRLAAMLTELHVPVVGHRGFNFAEVTAGGVPLAEVHLKTLESRISPGLHLCGEILDVDGRIGGFNFQWAWASGFVAGTAAAG